MKRFTKALLLVASAVLTGWCVYNIWHIWSKYARMNTIITLERSPPVQVPFPGITVCAPAIVKPETLAGKYPKILANLFALIVFGFLLRALPGNIW